jgi:SEC-C motif-containing protein
MTQCPCGSNKTLEECCGPYLAGDARPPTAEALLRARYSAFATHEVDFIVDTIHPSKRKDADAPALRKWSHESEWLGLEIVSTRNGREADSTGEVEFVASYKADGEELEHHERGEFRREGGSWYFWDGKLVGPGPVRREGPKVGRNDPCPCGSGKKHKKCCGR